MTKLILTPMLGLLLTACGAGSGTGLDPTGQPAGNNPVTPLAADFASIQQNVLTPVCTVCHAGASAPLGLRLDAANSYTALVNVSSVQVPGTLRVNPGNPNNSYLIAKLEGTAGAGAQMPLGGPALPQATIEVVKQWILAGAPAPVTTPPPVNQPPTVISTSPANGSTLTTLPATINVAFSQEMNAASINSTTVILQRSGGDGNFTSGNEVTVAPTGINLSIINQALLTIDLGGITSRDDTYQLKLVGTGAAPLLDRNNNVLDGDSNGSAGGDFALGFTVQTAGGGGGLQATWRSIQDNVFTPHCIVCHSGAGAPEGLRLDESNSFAMLVGVASQQVPTLLRVAPNNANSSYLIQKLEGVASVGTQMPRGSVPLPSATIDIVRQWINAGATQGTTTPSPPPPVNSEITLNMSAPASVSRGDELTVSVSVANNSGSSINGLSIMLAWAPQTGMRLRSGDAVQSIASLNAGQSTTFSWTLRAEELGDTALTVSVTNSNSQTVGSSNANVSIVN